MRRFAVVGLLAGVQSQYNPLLNRNNGVSERNFIEIPQMGSDVNVTCGGREIIIAISSDYIQRNLQWLENGNKLSLTDLSCKAVQDRSGNRIIRIRDDFTKCGNRITTDTMTNELGQLEVSSYKITNKLVHDDPQGNIAREIDLVEFDCVYPATQMVSEFMQPWLKSAAHDEIVKDLTGRMMLYKDSNYTEPYMEPPTLSLNDDLFIQVELEKPILTNIDQERTQIAVVLEQCWGTPTQDREGDIMGGKYGGTMKYFMIKDGCPVDDPSLKIVSNGIKLKANYQIKMFKFIGEELNDVWLHCTVRACNSTVPDQCAPDCGNDRSKRSLGKMKQKKKKLWYVSGPHEIMTELPIQRQMTAEELEAGMDNFYGRENDKSLLEPGSMPFKIMLIILAVIVALSAIMTIVCIYVKRRNALLDKYGNRDAMVVPTGDVMFGNQLKNRMPGNQPSSGPSSTGTGSDKFMPY